MDCLCKELPRVSSTHIHICVTSLKIQTPGGERLICQAHAGWYVCWRVAGRAPSFPGPSRTICVGEVPKGNQGLLTQERRRISCTGGHNGYSSCSSLVCFLWKLNIAVSWQNLQAIAPKASRTLEADDSSGKWAWGCWEQRLHQVHWGHQAVSRDLSPGESSLITHVNNGAEPSKTEKSLFSGYLLVDWPEGFQESKKVPWMEFKKQNK